MASSAAKLASPEIITTVTTLLMTPAASCESIMGPPPCSLQALFLNPILHVEKLRLKGILTRRELVQGQRALEVACHPTPGFTLLSLTCTISPWGVKRWVKHTTFQHGSWLPASLGPLQSISTGIIRLWEEEGRRASKYAGI